MSVESGTVVIVGGGPTGLTLGCLLHRRGVPCRVIDQAPAATPFSRALGMFTRSLEILDEFGAAEEAIARGHRIEYTNIYSRGRRLAAIPTAALRGTRRRIVLALPQYETEQLLGARFEELGGSVERERELIRVLPGSGAGPVALEVAAGGGVETIEADWVVGADGAHSAVRKALGIGFPGAETRDVFTIFDAFVENGPRLNEVHYYFSPEGLTVASPLPDGSYRFAASMAAPIDDGLAIGEEDLTRLLRRRIGDSTRIVRLRDAGWGVAQVRGHTRIAAEFRRGRCLLAGDAAHVYGPLGGQGMNGGIQDAHNLAWKLALVARGEARPDLLDSYSSERRAISRQALRAVSGQARLGALRPRAATALRDGLVRAASRAGLLERQMLPQSVMLAHRYPAGPAVAGRRRGPRGRRLPDAFLRDGGGRMTRLFEHLRERPFTVLALACGPGREAELAALAMELSHAYGDRVALLAIGGEATAGGGLADDGGELMRAAARRGPTLCLARADGFAACSCPLGSDRPLRGLLDDLLVPAPARSAAVPT